MDSPQDQPTLRIHLERLTADKKNLISRFNDETAKLEALKNGIEQYRGAISYNQNLIDSITKELEDLNQKAFSAQARSLSEVIEAAASGAKD